MRIHLGRMPHRKVVAGTGSSADGRWVAFEGDAEISDYGGQMYDDRYCVTLSAPLMTKQYLWWNDIKMIPSKIVDGSHPNCSHGRYANYSRNANNVEIRLCRKKKMAVVYTIHPIYEGDEIYVAYD